MDSDNVMEPLVKAVTVQPKPGLDAVVRYEKQKQLWWSLSLVLGVRISFLGLRLRFKHSIKFCQQTTTETFAQM
ncbi:unnamed protein product, partial [Cyprideis torosa]